MRMKKSVMTLLLTFAALACESNPAEVKKEPNEFPLRANWSATVAPATDTLRASTTIKEFLGSRLEAAITVTGAAPNAAFQWRIFKGDCATTTTGSTTTPTGLALLATTASYPDITPRGGTGTVTPEIAGALDSLTAYSVRIRAAQTATNWNGLSPLACGNLQRS